MSNQSMMFECGDPAEPVQVCNDPANPNQRQTGWFLFPTVRDYFVTMTAAAKACADQFDSFFSDTTAIFESLPNTERVEIDSHTLAALTEELPIRALKRHLSLEEYNRLLKLISSREDEIGV